MINLCFKQASTFVGSNCNNSVKFSFPLTQGNVRKIYIGRGQDIQELNEKTSEEKSKDEIIDLCAFNDKTISRVHCCIIFSPLWLRKHSIQKPIQQNSSPQFMKKFTKQWQQLTDELLSKIWGYAQPRKQCLLKDLKSKSGIFEKVITPCKLESELLINFAEGENIEVQNKYFYEDFQSIVEALQQKKQESQIKGRRLKVLGDAERFYLSDTKGQNRPYSFWEVKSKQENFIILNPRNSSIQPFFKIGRSSSCDIQISNSGVSRKHAFLKYQNSEWHICDGSVKNGEHTNSQNGTWIRKRKIMLSQLSGNVQESSNSRSSSHGNSDCHIQGEASNLIDQKTSYCEVKIGSIKCEIEVKAEFEWLNIADILRSEEESHPERKNVEFRTGAIREELRQ